jgi:hypothetical protein
MAEVKLSTEKSGDLRIRQAGALQAGKFARFAASGLDSLMCASINLLQSRHRLHARSRDERWRLRGGVRGKLTAEKFYAV